MKKLFISVILSLFLTSECLAGSAILLGSAIVGSGGNELIDFIGGNGWQPEILIDDKILDGKEELLLAGGFVIGSGASGGGGSCTTILDSETGESTVDVLFGTDCFGHLQTADSSDNGCKLVLKLGTVYASQTLTVRIGTGVDLSDGNYLQEKAVAVTSADNGTEVQFEFPSSVTGSTTYYWAIMTSASIYAERVTIARESSGVSPSRYMTGTSWVLDSGPTSASFYYKFYGE